MKARRSGTNDQWEEIKYVQLKDSDTLYKAEVMEFDVPLSESELYEQIGLENRLQDYWQDVRERAAIAAMQGMLANPELMETMNWNGRDYRWNIEKRAILYADALIEELKKK